MLQALQALLALLALLPELAEGLGAGAESLAVVVDSPCSAPAPLSPPLPGSEAENSPEACETLDEVCVSE
mgnify:CR=1 FL=1